MEKIKEDFEYTPKVERCEKCINCLVEPDKHPRCILMEVANRDKYGIMDEVHIFYVGYCPFFTKLNISKNQICIRSKLYKDNYYFENHKSILEKESKDR